MNIIHKKCDRALAKDKSLPVNSYLVTYLIKDEKTYDIVQAGSFVEVFDRYYDEYGKGVIQKIEWTQGTVNPKTYGYSPKDTKKKK